MRNSKVLYPTPKETDFNIFMSGPDVGPVLLASDIVKNMMDKSASKRNEPKLSSLDKHNYPELGYRSSRYGQTSYLKPMSQSTGGRNH